MNDTPRPTVAGPSPYDTVASSGLRFAVEIIAWVAGPWAVADLTEQGWTAIPALVFLLALPAVFNTPGDKKQTGVPTPGPIRIGIELFLTAVAIAGAWIVWPAWAAVLVSVVALASWIAGRRRVQWLAAGAPPVD